MRELVLFASALAGLGAALMAARRPDPPPPEVQVVSEEDTESVPVPARTIARGEQLRDVEFLSIRWPKTKLPGSYLLKLEDFRGSYALTALPAHLPVPLAALSLDRLDANAVAEAIPPGMRAITVKVDAESAVEGWARSGSSIDVILVRSSRENSLQSVVIAENVRVLSAGSSAVPLAGGDTAPKTPNTITLLVSQEDALKVKTAASIGRLTFALRGTGDRSPTLATSLDQKRIFGSEESRQPDFLGRAKGPDGKTYVLTGRSKWLRSSPELSGFSEPDVR